MLQIWSVTIVSMVRYITIFSCMVKYITIVCMVKYVTIVCMVKSVTIISMLLWKGLYCYKFNHIYLLYCYKLNHIYTENYCNNLTIVTQGLIITNLTIFKGEHT